jgi:hypothetical protein
MQKGQWGGTLSGHAFDLQDWALALPAPYDPWVEKWIIGGNERYVLRSSSFEQAQDSVAAWEGAKALTQKLNGAFAIYLRAQSLVIEGVAERMPDGVVRQHAIVAGVGIHARSRAAAISASTQIGPSTVQMWLELADNDGLVEDLLMHQSQAPNWYDLYKAYEVIRALCARGVSLPDRPWAPPKNDLSSFTHTANYYRHSQAHSARQSPPANPMGLDIAKEMIRVMATAVLTDLSKVTDP